MSPANCELEMWCNLVVSSFNGEAVCSAGLPVPSARDVMCQMKREKGGRVLSMCDSAVPDTLITLYVACLVSTHKHTEKTTASQSVWESQTSTTRKRTKSDISWMINWGREIDLSFLCPCEEIILCFPAFMSSFLLYCFISCFFLSSYFESLPSVQILHFYFSQLLFVLVSPFFPMALSLVSDHWWIMNQRPDYYRDLKKIVL